MSIPSSVNSFLNRAVTSGDVVTGPAESASSYNSMSVVVNSSGDLTVEILAGPTSTTLYTAHTHSVTAGARYEDQMPSSDNFVQVRVTATSAGTFSLTTHFSNASDASASIGLATSAKQDVIEATLEQLDLNTAPAGSKNLAAHLNYISGTQLPSILSSDSLKVSVQETVDTGCVLIGSAVGTTSGLSTSATSIVVSAYRDVLLHINPGTSAGLAYFHIYATTLSGGQYQHGIWNDNGSHAVNFQPNNESGTCVIPSPIGAHTVFVQLTSVGTSGTSQSIYSINRVSTTATVLTASTHGLTSGETVEIIGVTVAGYNMTATITVTSSTEFTYTVPSTLGAATGGYFVPISYGAYPYTIEAYGRKV